MRFYYKKFEYASRRQTQLELITEVGLRLGAVRSIDLDDLDIENRCVHLRHRPEGTGEYGTPLKNGSGGERIVNLATGLVETIQDYIDHHRADVEDQFRRSPLFTTKYGRVTGSTIRRDFYKLTRPCVYCGECPHDREIADCEGTKDSKTEHCPSRFCTHPFRKWSIMHQLNAGMPMELLSDRVDVSVPILEKHYDHRSEERKSRRRLEELERHLPGYGDA